MQAVSPTLDPGWSLPRWKPGPGWRRTMVRGCSTFHRS